MLEDQNDYYLIKAEEYEGRAESEQFPNIQEAYRKLAAEYRKLAASATAALGRAED